MHDHKHLENEKSIPRTETLKQPAKCQHFHPNSDQAI
jgi:hypothetical protein